MNLPMKDALELMYEADTCVLDINMNEFAMPTTLTCKDKKGNVTMVFKGQMGFSKEMHDQILFKEPKGCLGFSRSKEFKIPE